MSNVIPFGASPLTPFLGEWIRDPISVSRNKVSRRMLGDEGLKTLWACPSIEAVRRCLDADPALAETYQARLRLAPESRMTITRGMVTWRDAASSFGPAETIDFPVHRVSAEGRNVIVHTTRRGRPQAFVLRMNKEWLLVSERSGGADAGLMPRSPVFRYHAAGPNG